MYYDEAGKLLCRKCLEKDIPEAELAAYLSRYIEELPETIRTPKDEFLRRAGICADCEKRIGYTCRVCGCYVQVRAAKREAKCPHAAGDRWQKKAENGKN